MAPKRKANPTAASMFQKPTYEPVKAEAIELLDENSDVQLAPNYGPEKQYNAKTPLYKALGIGPERMWALAPTVNKRLRKYPAFRPVTSAAMATCEKIGDFIALYCGGARADIPDGEPK